VLAGQSAGGFTVRLFAAAYPAEVAGVVLIDSTTPNPSAQAEAPTSTGLLSIATLPARIGLQRLLAGPLDLKGRDCARARQRIRRQVGDSAIDAERPG
jgi:pimeloyl-ACP methyl ester carboxylesterase